MGHHARNELASLHHPGSDAAGKKSGRTRLLLGVLAVGGAALVGDRLLMTNPQAAAAAGIVEQVTVDAESPGAGASSPAIALKPLSDVFEGAIARHNIDDLGADAFAGLDAHAVTTLAETERSGVDFICTIAVVDDRGGLAVINGSPLRPGDTVAGATLLRVQGGGAVLQYDGREVFIPVERPSVRPTPPMKRRPSGPPA